LRVPAVKIETFYNTVDMARYAPRSGDRDKARKKLGIAKDAFVVLGNGQVQPRKRLDIFADMANELPDVQFIWVGGIPFGQLGAEYSSMRDAMQKTPKNFMITGMIPHDDVIAYLHAADVFCLPAEQENHPMCVLEAAGAGLPVVVRDLPEYDDTFADDVLRCHDNDFLTAIAKLQHDRSEYDKWQCKSALIAKRFDSRSAMARYVELYRSLV